MAKNGEKVGVVRRNDVYTEFILWFAMPPEERSKLGIKDQGEFVEKYGIGVNTPTRWKDRPDFEQRVDKITRMWALDKTAAVIQGIYKAAVKGNPMSQLLWLQYFKGFNPKSEVVNTTKVEVSVNDIRFIIEAMPEPLRSKHYGNLRELLDDAAALRSSGQLEDRDISFEGPADRILIEANHDAQDVPVEKGNGMAGRHPSCLRSDLVGTVSADNHQGAARWW